MWYVLVHVDYHHVHVYLYTFYSLDKLGWQPWLTGCLSTC